MIEYMLDSDICIYVMKRKGVGLVDIFDRNLDALCISSIVLSELAFGAEKSQHRHRSLETLDTFVSLLKIEPFGADAARDYGRLRAHLEQEGTPCGPLDTLIGAHARSLGLTLVTNNRREFDRMPGLKVENWV
ncbi:MAG: type II toxin-antitoxin system VapC family toxin [Devosia sp.]|nr:type II toxin-antitoxin system VapC family toxin [Devosia sp.]